MVLNVVKPGDEDKMKGYAAKDFEKVWFVCARIGYNDEQYRHVIEVRHASRAPTGITFARLGGAAPQVAKAIGLNNHGGKNRNKFARNRKRITRTNQFDLADFFEQSECYELLELDHNQTLRFMLRKVPCSTSAGRDLHGAAACSLTRLACSQGFELDASSFLSATSFERVTKVRLNANAFLRRHPEACDEEASQKLVGLITIGREMSEGDVAELDSVSLR